MCSRVCAQGLLNRFHHVYIGAQGRLNHFIFLIDVLILYSYLFLLLKAVFCLYFINRYILCMAEWSNYYVQLAKKNLRGEVSGLF
jgi:hypothetical protein